VGAIEYQNCRSDARSTQFSFAALLETKLGAITAWQIEKWRSQRLQGGVKATTANRDLDDLRSSLAKAVAWNLLPSSPLATVRRSKVDNNAAVRFLSDEEEAGLRTALIDRDQRIRLARASANRWRVARNYPCLPSLSEAEFPDRLRPMVLLSLNTGLRRIELFSLTWGDIDFANAESNRPRVQSKKRNDASSSLNEEAIWALREWRDRDCDASDIIFPGKTEDHLNNVRRSWSSTLDVAGIERFRWHDLRHTFASRLVMAGVDLNTVRELLGHSDFKTTLRYAHLAPAHKAAAVATLNKRRISSPPHD